MVTSAYRAGVTSVVRNRGWIAWALAFLIISFYVLLYWDAKIDQRIIWRAPYSALEAHFEKLKTDPATKSIAAADWAAVRKYLLQQSAVIPGTFAPLASELESIRGRASAQILTRKTAALLDPLSNAMRGKASDKWFLYGALYTLLVVTMGIRFFYRWKHDRYQKLRTASVMFFQSIIAFALPAMMEAAGSRAFYFHYFWPLKFDYFLPSTFSGYPRAMVLWAVSLAFIGVPVLTYFYGKRWYCSWVCGCGALANTLGDPWRQLSDKSERAHTIEKITVYSVLAIAIITTGIIFANHFRGIQDGFSQFAFDMQEWYFFFISAGFAGVIGTGFYPLAGTRVWCRFGCPQAAILGIFQKFFSRFRITTNGGQCISCGNCSSYCEMGIDVRSYAEKGQDIVRAACVGCGLCMSVCPRGVLKLENGPRDSRLGSLGSISS